MIANFGNVETEALWGGDLAKARRLPSDIRRVALRKLQHVHAARVLADLAAPPNNRLEPLKGDLAGSHSIRINDQWRICFRWTTAGPEDVEIVDYH